MTPRSPQAPPRRKARTPRSWTAWVGFADGVPNRHWKVLPDTMVGEPVITVHALKGFVKRHYDDVRKVRITEVLPLPPRSRA